MDTQIPAGLPCTCPAALYKRGVLTFFLGPFLLKPTLCQP